MSSRFILPFADIGAGITPSDGAFLFFYEVGTTTDKDTFSDQLATPTPNANPVEANSVGVFPDIFINGAYDVVLKDKNLVQIWGAAKIEATGQSTDTVKNLPTLAAAVADVGLVDGDAINLAERTTGNGGGAMWDVVLSSTVTENTFNIVQAAGALSLVLRLDSEALNVKQWGALGDGSNDDTAAIQAVIDFSTVQTRHPKVFFPSGTYLISDQGSGFGLGIDSLGMTLEGEGNFNSSIKYLDTGIAVYGSPDGSTLREFITIRNILMTSDGITANTAINIESCPGTKLEDILIADFQDGVVTGNTWNASCNNVQVKAVTRYAFDLQANTNGITLQNCIGVTFGAVGSRCVRMNSSHGISIQGGAYEDSEFAFDIAACEVTIDTYVEGNEKGVITASNPSTFINIPNLYSFNNAEALPLFTMSGGFLQVQQMVDSPGVSTKSGSVFSLTGGARALYGIMQLDVTTILGSFAVNSAGYIKPMFPVQSDEIVSGVQTANSAERTLVTRLFRPWKIHSIVIVKQSGTISGANIQIGNLTDPDSICNLTLDNNDFQTLTFETSPTEGMYQTAGSYTNQTSFLFLTNDGGGSSSGTFQVFFRYHNGYNGNSTLPNINQPDDFISAENQGPTTMSVQFID